MTRYPFEGKTALISGAAGGIGSAIARTFAREGAQLVLLDLRAKPLEALAEELRASGVEVIVLPADITSSDSLRTAFAELVSKVSCLHAMINSAGLLRQGSIEILSESDWDGMMAVNVKGIFLSIKFALPLLKAAKGASVVNLSSVAAFVGSDDSFAYSTSKGAVLSMTYGLAQELAPYQIRVNAICPGWVDTGFTDQVKQQSTNPQEIDRLARKAHLLGRMARPDEIGEAAIFLASDSASFITGTSLYVDGGFMIKR